MQQQLSKKEQIRLRHEEHQKQFEKAAKMRMIKKWGIIGVVALILLGGFGWIIQASNQPLPGKEVSDLGRNHIDDVSKIKYNSNPPTSGPHFPVWAKPGVYTQLVSDGYFIHSLEHGYVIISYNCDVQKAGEFAKEIQDKKLFTKLDAKLSNPITPTALPAKEVELPSSFGSSSCKQLVSDLTQFTNLGYHRVIITPRPQLDVPIALTAWNHIQTFEKIEREKIETFISSFHNKGPEATME